MPSNIFQIEIELDIPESTTQITGEVPPADFYCFIDGSCKPNPGEMGAGICMIFKGETVWEKNYKLGRGTNNAAEFYALIIALRALKQVENETHAAASSSCLILSDSSVLVQAVKKETTVKDANLKTKLTEIEQIWKELSFTPQIQWIHRSFNKAHNLSKGEVNKPLTFRRIRD